MGRHAPQPRRRERDRDPVGDDRPRRRPSRQPQPGVRGTVSVPAASVAAAAAPDDVRDLDADSARDHRLLPRAASRGDSKSCQGEVDTRFRQRLVLPSTQREAAGPAATALPDRGGDTEPAALPCRAVHDDAARAGRRDLARHSDVRCRSAVVRAGHEDRLPATVRRGRSAVSAGCGGRPVRRRSSRGRRRNAYRAACDDGGDRQARRGSFRLWQRSGRPARAASIRATPGNARR